MKIEQYLILAGAGILVTVYKMLSAEMDKIIPAEILKKSLLALIVSVLIVPAVMEYFKLSITIGIALASVMNLFIELLMKKFAKKLEEKIDEL